MNTEFELCNILAKIGLTRMEQKIFLELAKTGPSTLHQISTKTKIIQPTVYRIILGLEEKGLVYSDNKKYGKRYTAHDPKRIVSLVAKERRKLRRLELDLQDFLPQMNALFAGGGGKPKVEIYQTKEGYETLINQSLECREKVIYHLGDLDKIIHVVGEEYDKEYYIPTRLKNGVTYRLLTFDTPLMREYKRLDTNQHRDTKFLSKKMAMNVTILIFDDTVAFFSDAKEMLALAITSESIAQAMKIVYNDLWSHAI